MNTPILDDGDVVLYHGDVLDTLRALPAGVAQTCITSPPYWGLRDYGTGEWAGGDAGCDHRKKDAAIAARASTLGPNRDGLGPDNQAHAADAPYGAECGRCGARRADRQLGLEASPDLYVERLVAVFREVWRVLRDDGTCWINLGDSYAASNATGHGGWDGNNKNPDGTPRQNRQAGDEWMRSPTAVGGLKPKDLVGIPWRVAFALQQPWYSGRIRDERDRIWLAAILDAEGCIHIHRRKAGDDSGARFTRKDGTETRYARTQDTFGVMVSIDNTSLALIDRCADLIGQGSRYTHEAGTGQQQRKQTLYRLTLTGQQSRDLLRELYPYLVAKRQQARIAYACPSSGEGGIAAHEAVKLLHNGVDTTIDYPEPSTLFTPGWYLRSDIIWGKSNPMPESVSDRPTKAHEYLFLLAKQPRYFYDADAIREPHAPDGRHETGRTTANGTHENHMLDEGERRERWPGAGRNRRSVWTIPTQPFPEAHFATFPEALVRPCVLAGTSERGECSACGAPWIREVEREVFDTGMGRADTAHQKLAQMQGRMERTRTPTEHSLVTQTTQTTGWAPSCDCGGGIGWQIPRRLPQTVLDPFIGSGTTALVARHHGRRCIGIDLSSEYLGIAARRLQQLSLLADPA